MKKRMRTSPIWTIEKEKLEKIVEKCSTMTEVLSYFGLKNKGGNHRTLKERLNYEEIDFQKFKDNFRKGRIKPLFPLDEVLVENSSYSRGNLKKRLIKDGLLKNECSNCGLSTIWDNKPLVMVLDHINGVDNDHRLCNLRLLCPNCNSQTDSFAGKKNKKKCQCGREICRSAIKCSSCYRTGSRYKSRKVERPSKEELKKLLWEKPTVQIAADLGVSDSAIYKWTKSYELEKPPRGYWGFKK